MDQEHAKNFFDWLSVTIAFATVVSWLPSIAALVSIVWGCIRIWESETVKKWTNR